MNHLFGFCLGCLLWIETFAIIMTRDIYRRIFKAKWVTRDMKLIIGQDLEMDVLVRIGHQIFGCQSQRKVL